MNINDLEKLLEIPKPPKPNLKECIDNRKNFYLNIINDKGIIPAIKALREQTNCGLKEAKDSLDKFMIDNNINYYYR